MLAARLRSRWPRSALAIALIGAASTGCYTTTLIPPKQASRLAVDALTLPGEFRAVRDIDGEVVVLGEDFTAQIETKPDLPAEWAAWNAKEGPVQSPFAVHELGPILVFQHVAERPVEAPLAYVKQIRVREFSSGKTAGLVIGTTLAVGLAALIAVLVAFPSDSRVLP
ncbi:MAG: hypothetical protein ABJE95_14270 [Byssovorax sp.]